MQLGCCLAQGDPLCIPARITDGVTIACRCGFWLYLVGATRHGDEPGRNGTVFEPPCVPIYEDEVVPSFIILTLCLCLLSRIVSVFPLAWLANRCRSKENQISMNEQCVIWFSGLRGAIALCLAVEFPTGP